MANIQNTLRYPIIFCDIDDTLLSDSLKISEENKKTIQEYIKMGGLFILATGRNLKATENYYNQLHLSTPIILEEGGIVYLPSTKSVLYIQEMDKKLLQNLCLFLEEEGVYFQLFGDNRIFVRQKTKYSKQFITRCGVEIYETKKPLSKWLFDTSVIFTKLMIECEEEKTNDILKIVKKKVGNAFVVAQSKNWIIEVSSPKSTKANALSFLLKRYDIKKENTMAIGDSFNDLCMFKKVGFSVAMENASEEIRQQACAITLSNNRSGVAFAIKSFAFNLGDSLNEKL